MTNVTVRQYVELRKQELDKFEQMWKSHEGDPEWPDSMPAGEWFEQEAAFGACGEHHD